MADPLTARATVLIRCDASKEIGLGHVVRCLALATELANTGECQPVFVLRSGTLGELLVRDAGHEVIALAESESYVTGILRAAAARGARQVVLDVRSGIDRTGVLKLRESLHVAVIDDPGDRRLAADVVFYPPIPQVKLWTWDGFTGDLKAGWEWVVLRREFADIKPHREGTPPTLLITMGGSDPLGMTAMVLRGVEGVEERYRVVVLGGGPPAVAAADRLRKHGHAVETLDYTDNVADLMAGADVAVASFGVTAYELAAAGVPAIYVCISADHAESSRALVEAGAGVSLGIYSDVTVDEITDALTQMGNLDRRRDMSRRGRATVDGRGARRVASYIMMTLGAK